MGQLRCLATPEEGGWRFRLTRRQGILRTREEPLPLAEWPETARDHLGVALLFSLMDGEEGCEEGDSVLLSHVRIATLSRAEAARLGLPLPVPYTLLLSHDVPIAEPDFVLRLEWRKRDGSPLFAPRRMGTALMVGDRPSLILDPLFAALEAIDAVNAASGDASPSGLDRRMLAYADFKARLSQLTGDLHADVYLRGLTIHHATGLGIDLEPGGEMEPFLPTLYGDRSLEEVTAENEEREAERERLLPTEGARKLQQRFLEQGARRHFTLGNGVYTVLDAPVAAALAVIERVNRADAETRQAFREDPLSFLIPAIEDVGGDGGVLCELRGYGERVVGVDDWIPPSLSFPLAVSRQWFPDEEIEIFSISIPDEAPLMVRAEEVQALQDRVNGAQVSGAQSFEHDGRVFPLTEALATTIQQLQGRIPPVPKSRDADAPESRPKQALVTVDNDESLAYQATLCQRLALPPSFPATMKTAPKPHQESGVDWLQNGYRSGAPGLLLADDMGLGKTYQVLAFLRWLREGQPAPRRRAPFLIVAPKTLLGNWRDELAQHLGSGALGSELSVFEQGLRELKLYRTGGNDTDQGRQTLDDRRIEDADLVLTTYETLRDYHLSFGKVRFGVIVYDEAQKLKNPASLMNRAAKAQQADFTLIMTGTPIENSVADLWTLLDIAWPGFLGLSLKDFLKGHAGNDPSAREELKRRLIEPSRSRDQRQEYPPIMLRRFKEDSLEGLPQRRVEAPSQPMPRVQQAAYDAVRARIRAQPGGALEALQHLRAISLHPRLAEPPESASEDAIFIADSARFALLFQILDRVHERREKALVFVDLREAQRALHGLIARRYELTSPQPEIINGATATAGRDRIRHAFQTRRGFDVLILGPKAAGFGLTLTAANHVVHLNRWWNPAVEDQCSDRVYRIGQDKDVTVYLPQAVHPGLGDASFDRILHDLLEEKRALSREIVAPTQFNDGDFRRLFEGSLGNDENGDGLSQRIDSMDWRDFELWVADELRGVGFSVQVTSGRADGGADVIAVLRESGRPPLFVQCKHSARGAAARIDEQAVKDLLRARAVHGLAHPGAVLVAVTNARFSLPALSLAQEQRVRVFDADYLPQLGQALLRLICENARDEPEVRPSAALAHPPPIGLDCRETGNWSRF